MYTLRFLIPVLFTLLIAAGCATVPAVPKAENKSSSGIGIAIRLIGLLKIPTYDADVVYFAKACADQERCEETVYASNYAKDGRVYWLNAPPGDYVAIAASFAVLNAPDTYITYFPKKLINLTRVNVEMGKFVYAGNYVFDTSIGVCPGDADETQVYYAERFEPGSPKCGLLKPTLSKIAKLQVIFVGSHAFPIGGHMYHYRGSIHEASRDDSHEKDFLMRAQGDIAEGGWRILTK